MLNEADKKSIKENAQKALDILDDQVFGLSEQERQIHNIVYDFLQSKDGKCCLLEGERNCGRESILQKVMNKFRKELRVINAGFVAADPNYQQELAREGDDGYSVFLIRDADKLITPQQQKFLYTMVDKATHYSWLVFFSISRQDFAQNLQKQATSRIPKVQVSFDMTHDFDEFCSTMQKFLIPTECERDERYTKFILSLKLEKKLKPVFQTSQYVTLKQLAAQLLMLFGYYCENNEDWNTTVINKKVDELVEKCFPYHNEKSILLKDQTLRSQSVFLCVWKLLQDKESEGLLLVPKTSYRNVFLAYKKLANNYYKPLDVRSDIYVYRELDHLVTMGLLKADESTNVTNTSFRKIWLHFNNKIVQETIPQLSLPERINVFLDTVL
ncbi:hypothetical protein GCK72_010429 [Caenorhabditis remanei]|uniref:Uncharacterized protein n=1 Tax=Caenorhabditis remanei TaxID=31234 RepID=A0A6A5H4R2_CAERE|nr:hypothetical protein GCK72_010429 [Caenorhabditis remanei]KAF1762167.1 hypothetical protein GCK72_010429 [Caenorhabditis remanei]